MLQSLARNQALVDGNKRLALASTIAFYGMNGYQLRQSNDAAYDLVTAVVAQNDDVLTTAALLKAVAVRRKSHGPAPRD